MNIGGSPERSSGSTENGFAGTDWPKAMPTPSQAEPASHLRLRLKNIDLHQANACATIFSRQQSRVASRRQRSCYAGFVVVRRCESGPDQFYGLNRVVVPVI